MKEETKNRNNLINLCVYIGISHSPICVTENVMDPIYLHMSFSVTITEKQVWCGDFIF